jgi:hypothetical protein
VDYRKKCEEKGDYSEAKKAKQKFEELRRKEIGRQMELIRATQLKEAENIEQAQKDQFVEFSQAWDNYMADYEATAYKSLEKLKEKHLMEAQSFYDKALKEARVRAKHSKELLELRKRQAALVRMKKYEEAEDVKGNADQLEEWEDSKIEGEVRDVVERKVGQLRRQHQLALAALLKRIQRDRNEQIKHRQLDSQRLVQRSINLRTGIQSKHLNEAKKSILELRRQLGTLLQEVQQQYRGRSSGL